MNPYDYDPTADHPTSDQWSDHFESPLRPESFDPEALDTEGEYAFYEFSLLKFPMAGGSEWTTLLQEECFGSLHGSVEQSQPSRHRRVLFIGAMASLVLLTLAGLWPQLSLLGGTLANTVLPSPEALQAQPGEPESTKTMPL